MKLEIKHLAPYLPYNLKVSSLHTLNAETGIGNINHIVKAVNEGKKQYRPILRPLSDLTKEIEHKEGVIIPKNVLNEEFLFEPMTVVDGLMIGIVSDGWIIPVHVGRLDYVVLEKLFEWHFDVFGLIEKGLAVNLNSISI